MTTPKIPNGPIPRIVHALPVKLQKELAKGSDLAVALALRDLGGVDGHLGMTLGEAIARYAAAFPIGYQMPARDTMKRHMMPSPYAGFGADGNTNPGPGRSPRSNQIVARIPFSLFDRTLLAAGVGTNTSADPQQYFNGSNADFVITHIGIVETDTTGAMSLTPSFFLKITPNQSSKYWMRDLIPAQSFLSYQATAQAASVTARLPLSHWNLDAAFTLGPNGSLYCEASNDSAADINVNLGFVGYKNDAIGTPRIFSSNQMVLANTARQAFNAANFQNDGDAQCDISDVLVGTTDTWGAGQASPSILIRPDGNSGTTTGWTGNGSSGVMAACLNNEPGAIGPFWKLKNPQTIAPGTGINVEYQNRNAGALNANVAFTGYLNIRGR